MSTFGRALIENKNGVLGRTSDGTFSSSTWLKATDCEPRPGALGPRDSWSEGLALAEGVDWL